MKIIRWLFAIAVILLLGSLAYASFGNNVDIAFQTEFQAKGTQTTEDIGLVKMKTQVVDRLAQSDQILNIEMFRHKAIGTGMLSAPARQMVVKKLIAAIVADDSLRAVLLDTDTHWAMVNRKRPSLKATLLI